MHTDDWWKWGLSEKRKTLGHYPDMQRFLASHCGLALTDTTPQASPVWHSRDDKMQLLTALFAAHSPHIQLSTDPHQRLKRSMGHSYRDLVQVFTGQPIVLVDAVAIPQTEQEVLEILQLAQQHAFIVVAFGGGTNVVRALHNQQSHRAVLVVDMSAMNQVIHIDTLHHTASFRAGILGPALEDALQGRGFTMGHFPQSFEYASLGGWIATRSAGQESSRYGKVDDMIVSLRVATPQGLLTTQAFSADADGINLKSLFLGSEGTLGIITEATVKIHPMVAHSTWVAAVLGRFEAGHQAVRLITQMGLLPSVVRLSDEDETEIFSLMSEHKPTWPAQVKKLVGQWLLRRKGITRPNLLLLRFDGPPAEVRKRVAKTQKIIRQQGGLLLGSSLGKKWQKNRFNLPYLRDDFLEKGFLLDTAETVVPWDQLGPLHTQLQQQLRQHEAFGKEKGLLLAHLSHVYPNGATIYFTLITPRTADAVAQWESLKTITNNAFAEAKGAVSHHHGIGLDNLPWYLAKTDPITLRVLNTIKQTLDPKGILNPHKLYHAAPTNYPRP